MMRGMPPERRKDFAACRVCENVTEAAGYLHAMIDVLRRLLARQRLEVIAPGDALRQLAKVVLRKNVAQLGLANQNDLQQLLPCGFPDSSAA